MEHLKKMIENRIKDFEKDITPYMNETLKHKIQECICLTLVCELTLYNFIVKLPLSMEIIKKAKESYNKLKKRENEYLQESKLFKDKYAIEQSKQINASFTETLVLEKNLINTLFFLFETSTTTTILNFELILNSRDSNELLEGFLGFIKTLIGGIPNITGFIFSILLQIEESVNKRKNKLNNANDILNFLENYIFICTQWAIIVEVYSLVLENYPNKDFDYLSTAYNTILDRIKECAKN